MAEQVLETEAVRRCVETFGSSPDPAVLLIAGGAQPMVWWEDEFWARLAAGGRFVVRYDHRDTGRSTSSPVGTPSYTGGGLAQVLAVTEPSRVRTLTLVATSPAGTYEGSPLPGPEPQVAATFDTQDPEPDWDDREAVLAYRVDAERPYVGSLGLDEPRVWRLAALEVDGTEDMAASMTNHFLVGDTWPAGARVDGIGVPTMVVHGTTDPMFPLEHGRALAGLIPDARLLELEGVGHQQPPPERWDVALSALLEHAARR